MQRLLILDFDGTMTDAEREGVPFRAGYLEDLATLTARPLAEIERMAAELEHEVARNHGRYGWQYNGHIVAPATVDPYLRIMPVARRILDACDAFPSERDRSRLLDGILYKYNYQKTEIAFRDGALELLTALPRVAGLEAYVVTNSHTDPVRHKIRVLGAQPDGGNTLEWLFDRIHGQAKKYVIDEAFTAMPEMLMVPGLERPVLLRRRHYVEALEGLRARHGVAWSDVWVVGDIFELDLAVPLTCGANVVLIANQHTPVYEQAWLKTQPRARVVRTLHEVREMLAGG